MLVAALGALTFVKLKVPAGAFLGSMLFVAVFNVLSSFAFFPVGASVYIRIFAGALLGSRMTKSDVIAMKSIVLPGVLLVFGMLVLNLLLGYGIYWSTGLELSTALLGSAPGGVQDMALIADDLGANAAQVALLQTVRLLAVLGIFPTLLRAYCRRNIRLGHERQLQPRQSKRRRVTGSVRAVEPEGAPDLSESIAPGLVHEPTQAAHRESIRESLRSKTLPFVRTMAFASIGGFLLNLTPLPAGAMVGAMLATVLAAIFIKPSYMPGRLRAVIMTFSGALIGSGIGAEDILRLRTIIVPAGILVLVLLAANFVFGILIHKITKLDLTTALFASAAGGLTDMAIIADEMGADSPKVAVLQLLRLICVITLSPTVIKVFSDLV